MAILDMKKIEIVALLRDSEALIDMIQRIGKLQLVSVDSDDEVLTKINSEEICNKFAEFQEKAQETLKVLDEYKPEKTSMFSSFEPRKEMSVSEFTKELQNIDEILNVCYSILSLDKQINDAKVEIIRAKTGLEIIQPWLSLNVPTSFTGTDNTAVFFGTSTTPYKSSNDIAQKAAQIAPDLDCDFEIISQTKSMTAVAAVSKKEDGEKLSTLMRSLEFTPVVDPTRHPPQVRHDRLTKKIEDCEKKIENCKEKIQEKANFRKEIKFLNDCLTLRYDKYDAIKDMKVANNVFIITGYIPTKYLDEFLNKIESKFDIAYNVIDPDYDDENETVPTAVESKALPATMESITDMYSPPSHKDIDPNPIMTFFYFMLAGMMLGDAGYGILMVLACLFIKIKYKLEPEKRKTVNFGLFFGIGTTFWGMMFNSWFGDLPAYIAGGLKTKAPDFITTNHLYWFNTLDYTTAFLLFCFFIGIIHLIAGLLANMYKMMKKQKLYLEGLLTNLAPILLLIGVLPIINSQIGGDTLAINPRTAFIDNFLNDYSKVFTIILLAGVVLMIIAPVLTAIKNKEKFVKVIAGFGTGLNDVYGAASGYLGDVLSYARLLALGLCTGVIASVINELAAMIGSPIAFVIIAFLGHTINLGINLIGAYVHANRLQYVEFFGKFYEGGGKQFQPLRINTQTFKIKEEN
ncbi:MAG: V-type ATP synthase subunit I [Clostridia bacterium]|nr:V-type ATP synthase subunit I [Clostridia bacterium]